MGTPPEDGPSTFVVPGRAPKNVKGALVGEMDPRTETADAKKSEATFHLVWGVLLATGLTALVALVLVWLFAEPVKDTLWYEVAKTSLQVLAVAAIGGIVTAAAADLQHKRQVAAGRLQYKREAFEADLQHERQQQEADIAHAWRQQEVDLAHARQLFEIRTALLDQALRCAHGMFVTCQHVRRVRRDNGAKTPEARAARESTEALLDSAYLSFSSEGEALEGSLGARYGILRLPPENSELGEPFLWWHQIRDLLTAYYFNLKGGFRKDLLERNSPDAEKYHSGLNLVAMVGDGMRPTENELHDMRDKIRKEYYVAATKFCDAMMRQAPMLGSIETPPRRDRG
jgi:hypothetical protein